MSEASDKRSAAFRAMAARIDLNAETGFGGACVIIPPGGDAHDMLILDTAESPVIFWATLKSRVDIALAEIDQAERSGMSGFGGRR